MNGRRPIALITGASSGIGAELARVFARNGHELALVARRADRLHALAAVIAAAGAKRPIVIAEDLEKPEAPEAIARALAHHNAEPQFLVNNAGFGLLGAAETLDRREQLAMIDVNVRALTELSLLFADSVARHRGGILNVASVAGFLPGPYMAVYYATKAYVVSLSEAMHAELAPQGVRVCALCPGPVPTEFGTRAGAKRGMGPALMTISAERVAREGYQGLMAGRRLVVPGLVCKIAAALAGTLPRGWVLAAINSAQRRRAFP